VLAEDDPLDGCFCLLSQQFNEALFFLDQLIDADSLAVEEIGNRPLGGEVGDRNSFRSEFGPR
jgi:hypothetical protein